MFRIVMLLITSLISTAVFAATLMRVPRDTIALFLVNKAEILDVQSTVEAGRHVTYASVELTMTGCVDQLGPYTTTFSRDHQGRLVIRLTAYELVQEASEITRCLQIPKGTIKIRMNGRIPRHEMRLVLTKEFQTP
jgi:hypothetical protein